MAEVSLKYGRLLGEDLDGYYAFRGIPYAKPPVGDLRWKHPQPVESWDGVREAIRFGAPCCQAESQIVPGGDPDDRGTLGGWSEDCLYLNVFTPSLTQQRLPVFVWIHGGAYCCGSGAGINALAAPYVKRGIVYVSFNYRIGIMGFFAHPELAAENEQGISGNYAHYDQLAALKWVHENISAFGGDPNNVTISGSSAGAGSAQILCNAPLAKGLFQRAIINSGLGISSAKFSEEHKLFTMDEMQHRGVEYMHLLGCTSIAELRAMSYEELVAPPEAAFRRKYHYGTTIGSNQDGYLIPVYHTVGNENCTNADIPYIIGHTHDEGAGHMLRVDKQRFIDQCTAIFKDRTDEYLAIADIEDDQSALHAAMSTHLGFAGAKAFAAKSAVLGKAPVYVYDFVRPHPERGLAVHGTTTKYMFSAFDKLPHANADDEKVAQTVQTYFCNFIRTGDPNSPDLPYWAPYSAGNRSVCYFDVNTVIRRDEDAENPLMRFAREFLEEKIINT